MGPRVIAGFFLVTIAAGMAAVYDPVQADISRRMELLKFSLLEDMEAGLGRRVTYGSVSPSILHDVEVRDLRIRGFDGSSLVDIPLLKIHYNPLELLFGDPAAAVDEIVLENARVSFDADRDRDFLARLDRPRSAERGEPSSGRSSRIRITGRNLRVRLVTGSAEFEARKLFFQVQPGRDGYALRLRSLLSFASRDGIGLLRQGETVVELQGLLGREFDRGEGTVGFSRFETNVFDLEKQTFQVSLDGTGVRARKIQDRAPLDFAVSYDFAEKKLRGEVLSEKFRPSSLVTLKGNLAPVNDWLGAVLSVRGNAVYDVPASTLAYAAEFDAFLQNARVPQRTRFAGKAAGDGEGIAFSPVVASSSRGRAEFAGDLQFRNFLPRGRLALSDIVVSGPGLFRGTFEIGREKDVLSVRGESLAWGEASFPEFRGTLAFLPDEIDVDGRLLFDAAGDSGVDLRFRSPRRRGGESRFSARVRALPSEILFAAARAVNPKVRGFSPRLVIDGSAAGTTDFETFTWDVESFTVRDAENADNVVSLSGAYGGGVLDVREWQFGWKGYEGSGVVSGELAGDGRVRFTSESRILGVTYDARGIFDPGGSLTLDVRNGLSAGFFWGESEPVNGYVKLDKFPLALLRDTMEVTGRIEAHYRSGDLWYLTARDLTAAKVSVMPHVKGEVVLSATLGPGKGTLQKLSYRDQYSRLDGGGTVSYAFDPPAVKAEIFLSGNGGNERYDLVLRYGADGAGGMLAVRGFPLERLSSEETTGRLDGSLTFAGLPGKPEFGVSARLADGIVRGERLSFELSAAFDAGRAAVTSLDARYGNLRLRGGSVRYDRGTGALRFSGTADSPGRPSPAEWNLEGDFNVRPAASPSLRDSLFGADVAGEFFVSTASDKVRPLFRYWGFTVFKEGRTARVRGGPENSLEAAIAETGAFTVSVRSPLPVVFEAEGTYRDGILEANVNRISFLAEDFGGALDLKIIRFTRGRATGNLRISGPARDPDFFGTIAVAQGYAHLALTPEDLGPYRGNVIFREKEFTIQPMTVPVGRGSAEVTGVFQINRWIPRVFSLDVDTRLSEGVHIAYNFGGVIVDGMGQGRVKIEGDQQGITVSGGVYASNAVITLGDLKAARSEKKSADSAPLRVDLEFETGKAVEFYWPSPEFPILQTYANRGEKLALQFDGDTEDFRLVGDISVRGGEIFYFDRRFFIREGSIRFNERTGSFDPVLNARAEIRETTEEGLVRIYLVADNSKLSQFSPRFESDSNLTDSEIMAVLGRNIFGPEGEGSINLSTALLFTSDILTQIGVVKTFEREMRERMGLDLFSVRTHLVQNLLEGVVSRENETGPVAETPSFGRYLDKTSLFLGKYIGSDLFLELLLQLRAEDPLLAGGSRNFGGLDIDTELILEWKTPLFLLEWSFFPKNPEELFIRDNKFTFRWKFSY